MVKGKKPVKEKEELPDVPSESNQSDKTEEESYIPEEIINLIPEEQRGKFLAIFKSRTQSIFHGGSPLSEKITPEHITTIINYSDDQDKRDRVERKSERNYNLILIGIGIIVVLFLIIYLEKNESLLRTILFAIFSFLGGFGVGKTYKKKD